MSESYDLANHLLVVAFIVFYWHLLRIWHQPPPSDHDEKTTEKKAAAGPDAKLAGIALRQLSAPSTSADRENNIAPTVSPENPPLAAIRAADATFEEAPFLAGAARAYELILNAYAEEDTVVLEKLLDPQIASAFADGIAIRRARGERSSLTFIGIENMEIMHASAEANMAEISVRFTSEAVTATYASDGALLDGDSEKVVQMTDQWTFGRSLSSKDPNWKVVATEGG